VAEAASALSWTCARCGVTASWMEGVERPALPANWGERNGESFCLGCLRELAGDDGLEGAPEDASLEIRRQLRSAARVEFEIKRDPDRADGQIAQACHTSIPAIKKARARMGVDGQRADWQARPARSSQSS
jgi:hypothetical protein